MLDSGLDGLGVLVTRPARQAGKLRAAVERARGRAVMLPLLSIAGPIDAGRVEADLRAARDAAWWLFTSPNAVAWAARLCPPDVAPWPAKLAAAGRGTAAALAALGRPDAWCPESDGAAGLLGLSELRQDLARGASVAVACGEGSPPWLARGLRERGVVPRVIGVYRRLRAEHPPADVEVAVAAVDAAIVSSGEALQHFYTLVPETARTQMQALQLALPSARVVEMARRLGFLRTPLVPRRVSDEGFVHALVQWRRTREGTLFDER